MLSTMRCRHRLVFLRNHLARRHATSSASAAYTSAFSDYEKRDQDYAKQHPNLFLTPDKLQAAQKSLLDAAKKDRSARVAAYNQARDSTEYTSEGAPKAADDGLHVFKELTEATLDAQVAAVELQVADKGRVKTRADKAVKLMSRYLELPSFPKGDPRQATPDITLKVAERDRVVKELEDVLLRLADREDEAQTVSLPPTDDIEQFYASRMRFAPLAITCPPNVEVSAEDKKIGEDWEAEQRAALWKAISSNPNYKGMDKKQWEGYLKAMDAVFHPRDISHYRMNEYAKSLFRAAVWNGANMPNELEGDVDRLSELLESSQDDGVTILRRVFERQPEMPLKGLAAQYLEVADPLQAMRLVAVVREELDKENLDRVRRQIVAPYWEEYYAGVQDGMRERMAVAEKKEADDQATWSDALRKQAELTPGNDMSRALKRQINDIDSKMQTYHAPPASLEAVVDRVVPRFMWSTDPKADAGKIDAVKTAFFDYAKGKKKLEDLDKALRSNMLKPAVESTLTEGDRWRLIVAYHNSRRENPTCWNISSALSKDEGGVDRTPAGITAQRTLVTDVLLKHNFHPLIINLLKVLVQDNKCERPELENVLAHYKLLVKAYRGEVDGVITSATELSKAEFDKIKDILVKQNPGKKFFLQQKVDPGLLGGFVVTAGVQRLDFSLVTEIETFKKSRGFQ